MRLLKMLPLLLVVLCGRPVFASDFIAGPVEARVIKVQDGDSLIVMARIWPGHDVRAHVRLRGIDAPELRGKCEQEKVQAKEARSELVRLVGTQKVFLRRIDKGKYYGRVLARVDSASGIDLADALLEAGLARPYEGRKRHSWCADAATASVK